ncbi:polysaccharide pyruvyl transferase family protein [Salimicrobium sp. PL1-032A]|uniref:polysaccharide pyruvyl transferase family protein n=1 Tax=Salimicrobium sp. PL1-032A TaxID=3095364 RepID=UPI003260AFFB
MKKIGVITLNGYFNYGNRLQNYALEQILNKNGCYVETIWIDSKKLMRSTINQRIRVFVKKNLIDPFYRWEEFLNDKKRLENFEMFSLKYLNEKRYLSKKNTFQESDINTFDYFIVGSDQVWNPHYTSNSELYLLSFVPPHKRIAYAPSFGISTIPSDYKKVIQTYLLNYKNISVREEEGSRIIKDLTGKNVPVVLDPTLLLSNKEWMSIAQPPTNKPKKNYIVTYFLGEVSDERQKYIDRVTEKYNYKIIKLANKHDEFYQTDPGGFVDLIKDASLVLTDSFHGTVFSIIFERPFIVFERENKHGSMRSRIDTLLRITNLESRNVENLEMRDEVTNIDFRSAKNQLETEKTKSIDYLKNALET